MVDGLPFDESAKELLADLKVLAKKHSTHVWFTVRTHRHEEIGTDGMPASFSRVADLFEVAIQLQPEGKDIHVKALKGETATFNHPVLLLDPSTMLIKDKA